jgi:hypothetical protein
MPKKQSDDSFSEQEAVRRFEAAGIRFAEPTSPITAARSGRAAAE